MANNKRDLIENTPRNMRLDAGMQAKDVAALLGYSAPQMSRFERQQTNPTAATLGRFYAAVGRTDLVDLMLTVVPSQDRFVIREVQSAREARFSPVPGA